MSTLYIFLLLCFLVLDDLILTRSLPSSPARKGFHGFADHPMNFLVGEAGRERINIHKVKDKHSENFWDVSEYFGGRF
jgi:hypothetical protein